MTRAHNEWQDIDDRYRALFQRSSDAIFMLDLDFCVLDCNPTALKLLGFTHLDGVLGQSVQSLIQPETGQPLEEFRQHLFQQGALPLYKRTFQSVEGPQHVIEINIQGVSSEQGEPAYLQVIAHDITSQQERHIERIHALFTGIAHDTRTPISSVKTSLYLMRRKLGDLNPVIAHLDVVEAQIDRLNNLIETAMEFAHLDSHLVEFARHPVQIGSLVRQIIAKLDARFREKQLDITQAHETLPAIQGDSHYLGLAVEHLLLNARQFTPTGGSIRIETYRDGNQVSIRVQDSGTGISTQEQARVFEPFYKVDQSRTGSGHGLGLPIVKAIIEAHHGLIDIRSLPGHGTTVIVALPIAD